MGRLRLFIANMLASIVIIDGATIFISQYRGSHALTISHTAWSIPRNGGR